MNEPNYAVGEEAFTNLKAAMQRLREAPNFLVPGVLVDVDPDTLGEDGGDLWTYFQELYDGTDKAAEAIKGLIAFLDPKWGGYDWPGKG